MSLVEIMVVVAILGFLGLAVSTTFTDIFRMQSRIVGNDEANEFASAVGRFLFTESTCTAALRNVAFPTGGESVVALPGYLGYGGGRAGAPGTIGPGTAIGQKLRIKNIRLADKRMPPAPMIFEGAPVTRMLAQVIMDTESKVGTKWNANPPRNFEFPVLLTASNRILKCMTGSSMEDACVALGSTLDPATGRCRPVSQCFYEGAFTTNVCDGNMACTPKASNSYCSGAHTGDMSGCPINIANPINEDISCPSGTGTRNQTGVITTSYQVSCGKKCTRNVTVVSTHYICLRCQ